ncbi:MAG TPA: hypothetical protein VGD04_09290 [Methylophilus sp.]
MSLSIQLAPLDLTVDSTAKTQPQKIVAFTRSLLHTEPLYATSRLLEELKLLNRQKMDADTRISSLELYRKITLELSHELELVYGEASTPLSREGAHSAALAEALWLETGYGYKRALVDLKHKLFNLHEDKQHSLVILRILESLKNQALVNYLTYTAPPASLWSDLHKMYFHALQLSLEDVEVKPHSLINNKTINLVYIQVLLMNLANPTRLDKPSIKKMAHYVASLAKYAELRGMGIIENANGVFLIELDSQKSAVPYLKNRNTPNVETDILLVTVEVARQIHQQLKYIQRNKHISEAPLPTTALDVVDEDLLTHLIKYFGTNSTRAFPRLEKKYSADLAIGLEASCILFRSKKRINDDVLSEWEIMNISPDGYALRTSHLFELAVNVGDLITIIDHQNNLWSVGRIIWLSAKPDHLEAGIKLLAPSATSIAIKPQSKNEFNNALLLPDIKAVSEPISIVAYRGYLMERSVIDIKTGNKKSKLQIKQLIERSGSFERFEYSLIEHELS